MIRYAFVSFCVFPVLFYIYVFTCFDFETELKQRVVQSQLQLIICT